MSEARGQTATLSSIETLTRVSSMYYVENMTQEEIAKSLQLSRPKVGRLLKQAREFGIVEIFVNLHPSLALPMEAELTTRFSLKQVVVVGDSLEEDVQRSMAGKAVAQILNQALFKNAQIAVGMGRNVSAVSRFLSESKDLKCNVVSAIGGSPNFGEQINSNDITNKIAETLGGKANCVYAPAYVQTSKLKKDLLVHSEIKNTLELASQADFALVGVGDADLKSLVVSIGCISKADMGKLQTEGAVGDVLGHFFNRQGEPVGMWLEDRVIGISRKDLLKIPTVIAVVVERSKGEALLGALNSKMIDILVTTSSTAQQILKMANPA